MTTPITSFSGDYRFLSNFFPCQVELDGEKYESTEHAYQAAKSLDPEIRKMIRTAGTPAAAKKLGQMVKLRKDWENIKLQVMEDLLRKKFNTVYFAEELLATGDAELIEGNVWNDTFYGVCKGIGQNHLGKLLMKIRAELVIDEENLKIETEKENAKTNP